MVKIDTKPHFRIFHLSGEEITEKMAGELKNILAEKHSETPGNAIIVLPEDIHLSEADFTLFEEIHAAFVQQNLSFWLAPVNNELQKKYPLFDKLPHTPTLQEAMDMVMLEELEREMSDFDEAEE